MNKKYIVSGIIIISGLIVAFISFLDSNIEYGTISDAKKSNKIIQIKGEWLKNLPYNYNAEKMQFSFYFQDDKGESCMVVCNKNKPANFETAQSIVIKGKFDGDIFFATDILTKCPSKYEQK